MHAGRITTGQVHAGMWEEYYKSFRTAFETGIKPGILLEYGPDWAFNQQLVSNMATFAAFKNHSNTADMVGLLVDSDGTFKPYRKWRKDVDPILGQYNENWLQAEHQTATASARMAEKWRGFQRRKATYPNLKYITQADERVRASHRPLHHIVRPVDDPFWKVNYPPNGWRCRCDVQMTDEPVSGDPGEFIPPQPWRGNVGINKDLFPKNHPYRQVAKSLKQRVEQESRRLEGALTRTEVKKWAMATLRQKQFEVPGLPGPARMGRKDVNKVVSSYHPAPAIKNNLLYVLEQYLADGKAVFQYRKVADPAKHAEAVWFYYYLLTLEGEKFYLNFLEYPDGDIRLYAINDKIQ